jgi:hypothetical protein
VSELHTFRVAALAALVLPGCGGSPVPIPPDPIAALDLAESLLDEGRAETAAGLLWALERNR